MIAFDSSALVKLIVREAETDALYAWLDDQGDQPWVASALGRVEVIRAVSRVNPSAVPAARTLLAGIETVPLEIWLLEDAAVLPPPVLRSLDAIHLATARSLGPDLTSFVVYDTALATAAATAGLPIAQPS